MGNSIKKEIKTTIRHKSKEIQNNVENFHEFVEQITEMLYSLGIKLTLNKYPHHFNESISNSHQSPYDYETNWHGNNTAPKGYPGVEGTWAGRIEVINPELLGTNDVSFTDLRDLIPAINSGSGGGCSQFRFYGMLWVFDFPKIKLEWELTGGAINKLGVEYKTLLENYNEKYNKSKIEFISKDLEIQELEKMDEILSNLRIKIKEEKQKKQKLLSAEFNNMYDMNMPKPPSAFLETDKIMKIYTSNQHPQTQPHPNCSELFSSIEKTVSDMNDYFDSNPELFV